jgi:hypothetical protein
MSAIRLHRRDGKWVPVSSDRSTPIASGVIDALAFASYYLQFISFQVLLFDVQCTVKPAGEHYGRHVVDTNVFLSVLVVPAAFFNTQPETFGMLLQAYRDYRNDRLNIQYSVICVSKIHFIVHLLRIYFS